MPEIILRRVQIEGIMDQVSVPIPGGNEGTFEGADARDNFWDEEEDEDIWED